MDFEVRRLSACEVDGALELIWRTFLKFEAPVYEPEGVKTFRKDVMENEAFIEACRSGAHRMWGAFDGEKLVGVMAVRGSAHIALAFTDEAYHRKGVASSIFRNLVDDIRTDNPEAEWITVNSSPYGIPFYHHAGFEDTDTEKTLYGIRYTPMRYPLYPHRIDDSQNLRPDVSEKLSETPRK